MSVITKAEYIKAMNKYMKGKIIHAFGKDYDSYWGYHESPIPFKIKKIECGDDEGLDFVYVEVYVSPNQYKTGFIYTSKRFLRNINRELRLGGFVKLDYTEQGMQDTDYVSMCFKTPKKLLKLWM